MPQRSLVDGVAAPVGPGRAVAGADRENEAVPVAGPDDDVLGARRAVHEVPLAERALVESVRRARAEPERLAFESSDRYGYPPGFLARYFEKLRYSFGPRERAGLLTFLELAQEAGELAHVPELRFVTAAGAPV